MKIPKKIGGGGGGGSGGRGGFRVDLKIQKKQVWGVRVVSEVFVKIHKKKFGGEGGGMGQGGGGFGGVRVDVNGEF